MYMYVCIYLIANIGVYIECFTFTCIYTQILYYLIAREDSWLEALDVKGWDYNVGKCLVQSEVS